MIAEIRAGIENPVAEHRRAILEEWLAKLETAIADRLLLFDPPSAYALGRLLPAKPKDNNMIDTILAAQALSRDCPVSTRNTSDSEWTGVRLIDPWAD